MSPPTTATPSTTAPPSTGGVLDDTIEKPRPTAAIQGPQTEDHLVLPHTIQELEEDARIVGKEAKRIFFTIRPEGESGRRGFHPHHFFRIIFYSSSRLGRAVNILWPFVPTAIAVYYAVEEQMVIKFILSYIAMVPCANLIGFAGQEVARKMPHIFGVLTETTVASIVEIVLFVILLTQHQYSVIQAAILGSIMATMLLCLGLCFFASGLRREESTFDETVAEAGSGLLLTAGVGLAVPKVFSLSLATTVGADELSNRTLDVSRIVSILLIISYFVYIVFQTQTHHGIYTAVFEEDENRDHDRDRHIEKDKLTLTEAIVALVGSVGLVTLTTYILVKCIPQIVEEHHVSDSFMGLILVPLVEKAAEHLTAVDEAYDNRMNFALSHCLGATLQTALFNGPLVIIVGWGMGLPMDLNFDLFDVTLLVLSIVTVGNFMRDQKSNYLEGFLCVIVYVAIAVAAWYNPLEPNDLSTEGAH